MSKSRGAVCDTRCQQFQRECAKKEENLKTLWFLKNQQRLYDNLEKQKYAQKVKAALKKKTETVASPPTVKQEPLPSWRTEDAKFDLMKPIDPSLKGMIYTPDIASFLSKNRYFKLRYKQKPEDRFYYPYCSSWMFGWRLNDSAATPISEYGRKSIIQSSFYQRNASSLQRDPDWYRICQTSDPKNFNEILTN